MKKPKPPMSYVYRINPVNERQVDRRPSHRPQAWNFWLVRETRTEAKLALAIINRTLRERMKVQQ